MFHSIIPSTVKILVFNRRQNSLLSVPPHSRQVLLQALQVLPILILTVLLVYNMAAISQSQIKGNVYCFSNASQVAKFVR